MGAYVEVSSPTRTAPARNKWREAMSWAIIHLSRGLDGHHVRKGETWDTAILRAAAGHLSNQGYRLPIVDVPVRPQPDTWVANAEKVKAVLQRDLFGDLQRAAVADVPSDDGRVQGRCGRIKVPYRRGWRV